MKILVSIVNYGTKNDRFLQRLLAEYRSMTFDVRIIVLSNLPKDLGPDIEVRVGLPESNPRSLPFAYKEVFYDNAQNYDLYLYTEDDELITERNIRAFLRTAEVLPDNYIAGFVRSETAPDGTCYYSTLHAHFHWDPHSVMKRDEFVFARYTNDHSGCVLLTRAQLARALDSGGFMQGFRRGRYDYLETAATDPYTQCGLKKVIPISHLSDFCLPHLPNVYLGKIGLEKSVADREIGHLLMLPDSPEIRGPLFPTETKFDSAMWDKQYYERARDEVLALVPPEAKRILSIGCGWGASEATLVARGIEVVGLPLDCVVAVTARQRGISTLPPDFKMARRQLEGSRFDCILFWDTLHRLPDPVAVLRDYVPLLEPSGTLILTMPNFDHVSVLLKRLRSQLCLSAKDPYKTYGLHLTRYPKVKRWLRQARLQTWTWDATVAPRFKQIDRISFGVLRRFLVKDIAVSARPPSLSTNPAQ